MTVLWVVWGAAAGALLLAGSSAGMAVKGTPLGLLIDSRGRYSLNRFQLMWWLLIIISLVAGVAAARFTVPQSRPLGFSIPGPVLSLLGTVGTTTVVVSGVKAYRDGQHPQAVAASLPKAGFLGQILLEEEGDGADQTLDVGKFQALVITVLLGRAYVITAVYDFLGRDTPPIGGPAQIAALPGLDPTFVALLAVSSAAYVGNKLVGRDGQPPFSLDDRQQLTDRIVQNARDANVVLDGQAVERALAAEPRHPDARRPRRSARTQSRTALASQRSQTRVSGAPGSGASEVPREPAGASAGTDGAVGPAQGSSPAPTPTDRRVAPTTAIGGNAQGEPGGDRMDASGGVSASGVPAGVGSVNGADHPDDAAASSGTSGRPS